VITYIEAKLNTLALVVITVITILDIPPFNRRKKRKIEAKPENGVIAKLNKLNLDFSLFYPFLGLNAEKMG